MKAAGKNRLASCGFLEAGDGPLTRLLTGTDGGIEALPGSQERLPGLPGNFGLGGGGGGGRSFELHVAWAVYYMLRLIRPPTTETG